MKTSLVILIAVVAAASGQRNVDSRNAAILAEARYLSGDGSFGSAYVSEDQTEFKEETQANGDRKGQYSYIDPTGKKITVQYTAGKNGFQVSGDHLPKAPAPLPAAAPAPQYNAQPRYNAIPQQQYQQPQQQYQQQQPQQQYNNQLGGEEDGQYNPAVHEHPYQYREDNQQYQQSAPQPQPQQQNFNQGFNYQHQAAGFNNQQQQQPIQNYQPTTQAPTRFFPPGQLDLNRTPQGYNFQFQSSRQ